MNLAMKNTLMFLILLPFAFATNSYGQQALFGKWTIKRYISTPNVSALSDAEAKRMLGHQIEYSEKSAKSGRVLLQPATYEIETISEDEFFRYVGVEPEQLGFSGTIQRVYVNGPASSKKEPRFVGDTILLGGKAPIIELGGAFFELSRTAMKRTNKSSPKSRSDHK